jgi:hypothetical protein
MRFPSPRDFDTFLLVKRKQFAPRAGALMDHDPGTVKLSPATKELPRSSSAARMLRHRERRRKGLRFLGIELREREIEALIRRGQLHADQRANSAAVRRALYGFLDLHLV